jgi:hypothetical protein
MLLNRLSFFSASVLSVSILGGAASADDKGDLAQATQAQLSAYQSAERQVPISEMTKKTWKCEFFPALNSKPTRSVLGKPKFEPLRGKKEDVKFTQTKKQFQIDGKFVTINDKYEIIRGVLSATPRGQELKFEHEGNIGFKNTGNHYLTFRKSESGLLALQTTDFKPTEWVDYKNMKPIPTIGQEYKEEGVKGRYLFGLYRCE